MAGRVVDGAIQHAENALDAYDGAEYVEIRADVVRLLLLWIKTMRPVPTAVPDDFNRWQDHIDAATVETWKATP